MPVWPKSFYTFNVSIRTATTEWKLRKQGAAPTAQSRAFARIISRLAATSFWKQCGVEAGMTYADFRSRVPICTYEQLAPAIQRMKCGESDVLWPGRCALFAQTAGTSSGSPKFIPMTEEMLAHFRRAGLDCLLYYTVRARHAGAFRGRQLLFGSAPTLRRLPDTGTFESFACELSGIGALTLPKWAEKHLYEPGIAAAQVLDWPAKLAAIADRAAGRDLTMIAALPSWATILAQSLRQTSSAETDSSTTLQKRWPNLECFVHAGIPLAPYTDELLIAFGPAVMFHEAYVASEGFVAAQDVEAARGLRLMADTGLFLEFLPMADFDESRLDQLGAKALPLAEVRTGVDYALLMTTPGGLARYLVGDVVRFSSVEPPRIVHVGSTHLRLNEFGENVTEKGVTDALVGVCRQRGWTIVNFHVAPLLSTGTISHRQHGRHEWWIELRPGTIATPIGPQMATNLDMELQRLNDAYAEKRQAAKIDEPFVRLVMPGVFEHWLRYHDKLGGQHKVPRCRADRLVADELAHITNFARD
jgi:hypothetical protein